MKLCETAWRLYDTWVNAISKAQEKRELAKFRAHREKCPECTRMPK